MDRHKEVGLLSRGQVAGQTFSGFVSLNQPEQAEPLGSGPEQETQVESGQTGSETPAEPGGPPGCSGVTNQVEG